MVPDQFVFGVAHASSAITRYAVVCSGASGPSTVVRALAAAMGVTGTAVVELHVLAPPDAVATLADVLLDVADGAGAVTQKCQMMGVARDRFVFGRHHIHAPLPHDHATVPGCGPLDVALCNCSTRLMQTLSATCDRIVVMLDRECLDRAALALVQAAAGTAREGDRAHWTHDGEEWPLLPHRDPCRGRYSDHVLRRRRELAHRAVPPVAELDDAALSVTVDGVTVTLTPKQYFWYSVLALCPVKPPTLRDLRLAVSVEPDAGWSTRSIADLERLATHLRRRLMAVPAMHVVSATEAVRRATDAPPNLLAVLSKVKAKFEQQLGLAASPYVVRRTAEGGYGVRAAARLCDRGEASGRP